MTAVCLLLKAETGEVHDYLIDLGPDCNWKLAVVDGYTESLKVSEERRACILAISQM